MLLLSTQDDPARQTRELVEKLRSDRIEVREEALKFGKAWSEEEQKKEKSR